MKSITQQEITDYVAKNIQVFHQKRLDNLQKLKLMDVVRQKNPYLFKAKNISTAQDFAMLKGTCFGKKSLNLIQRKPYPEK